MTRIDPESVLVSHTEDLTVRDRLHSIRPHEVYEVEYDGRRAVCKIGTEPYADPAVEARVLELLDERTGVPVPTVLAVGEHHFVAAFDDRVPENPTVDDVRIRATGRGLAQLHADTEDHFDSPGLLDTASAGQSEGADSSAPSQRTDDSNAVVADGVHKAGHAEPGPLTVDSFDRWSDVLLARLADDTAYLETVGFADVAERVRTFVRDHRSAFDRGQEQSVALLHGNFLPEHVGVDRTGDTPRVSCVIDAEHALVGDPLYDLLRTGTPTFGLPWRTDDEEGWETLLDAYDAVRPLPSDVRDRFHWHGPVLGVSYLRALHVQRGDRDQPQEIARRAVGTRNAILATVEDLAGSC